MRTLLGASAGLLFGAILSSLSTACFCPAHEDMPPGIYRAGSDVESDYQLTVGSDKQVTESYTRGGKKYVVRYVATP